MAILHVDRADRRYGGHRRWRVLNVSTGAEMRYVIWLDTGRRLLGEYQLDASGLPFVDRTRRSGDRVPRRVRRVGHIHLCRATRTALVLPR